MKLRFRRRIRKGQRQVGELGNQAEQQIEEHLLNRFDRLLAVRRFVFTWLGLMVLLIGALTVQNLSLSGYYQTLKPVPGGIYNEGVLGRFTNANPLFAVSDADATVSRLIFSGLFNYDDNGNLVGDLAKDYTVDEHGTYTVHLKPNLKWQDGQPLTSADVAFTYQLIQNPDVQSPLQSGWQGVEISTPDPATVVFKLPGNLAAFPYSLTNGIVPKHLLANIKPIDMRSADFNTVQPVGAGPFAWQAIQVTGDGNPRHSQERIALTAFQDYNGGKPKLQKFIVQVYADQDQLIHAFADNQLTGAEGLTETPNELLFDKRVLQHSLPLRAATMVFFKTSTGVLSDVNVRQALVKGANVDQIVNSLGYPARKVREPFLIGQVGYDKSLAQASHDSKAAATQLDAAGWKVGKNGIRYKDGKPLTFTLTTTNTHDYRIVTKQLEEQWHLLGVKLNVDILDSNEFQTSLASHSYDAALYGISIGPDPDVFVYWDSSQADIRSANRLNLSEYKNSEADTALEAGRTRLDPSLRVIKYKPFLQAWQKDAPALGLYQPRLLYLTNGPVGGLNDNRPINTSTNRLDNVANWEIREAKVTD
jgi:peptide/nickel transport system substrate-binding protein